MLISGGGGSCLTILPMGWVLIQGGCLFVKGTYKGMCIHLRNTIFRLA